MGTDAVRCAVAIVVLASACAAESGTTGADTGGSSTAAETTATTSTTVGTTATGGGVDSTSGGDEGSSGSEVDDASSDDGTTGEPLVGPRYDQVQQKSAHNSYQRQEAILDQLVYHRVRSLELDIHVGKTFEPTVDGNWYVYHTDITDDETWCVQLDDCLDQIAAFDATLAEHELVTLWIDLKDPWSDGHGPAELDARLTAAFGASIVAPAELLAACPDAADLQSALLDARCGWPELAALRGRVLVVLTGGSGNLRTYHDAPGDRLALVAPAIASTEEAATWPGTSVFNFAAADVELAGTVAELGHVVRVWGNDDEASWDAAIAVGAHHVATDKVSYHEDPWAITHDADGWPFRCLDACTPIGPEPGAVIGVDVDSGDIWAQADAAWFLHDERADDPDGEWTALVSTANSHVEPFAKGCLVARASLAVDAAYFAVCRPADEEPLRVQWRAATGEISTAIEADIAAPSTVDPPAAAHVRLRVTGGGTCVAGDGRVGRADWVEIGTHCFAEPLALQGLAASSHDAGTLRLLFADVRRDAGPARTKLDFASSAPIGDATADVYDGVLP